MATSTVARNMANFISIVLFLAATALASTGSVSPSNSTLPKSESASETQLKLVGDPTFGDSTFNIAPLTVDAGLGQSLTAVAVRRLPLLHFKDVLASRIIANKIPYRPSPSMDPSCSQILSQ